MAKQRKKALSLEDSARVLLTTAMAGESVFFDQILPDISEYSKISLVDFDLNVLRGEVMIVCLWAAAKVLEGEQRILIQKMHDAFFDVFLDKGNGEFKEIFTCKAKKYDQAWDEDSIDNQPALAVEILSQLFCAEEPNESVLDIGSISLVQTFVFTTMKNVLDTRNEIDPIPEKGDYERLPPEQLASLFLDAVMESTKKAETRSTFSECDTQRLHGELLCLLMFAVHFTIHDHFGEEPEGIELHEAFLNHRIDVAEHATNITEPQKIIDAQDQRISHYAEVAHAADSEKWLQVIGNEFARLSGNERNAFVSLAGVAELTGMMNYVREMLDNSSC